MAQAGNQDLTERFIQFYRNYYRDEIGRLAQRYPNEQRSLAVDYDDLFQFDRDLAEDFRSQPDQMREYAEEALRLYDLPADVSLGRAHVRIENLPDGIDIRGIRVHDDHIGKLVSIQGIVRKATDVRPKVTEAAFECQRCGTMTYIPQSDGGFQEPHECQGCERQGPFRVNFDQSEFIDSQKLRIQESPEGLRGGETPQSIDLDIEDDITGEVSPGDHVTAVGVLHIEQIEQGNEKSAIFDLYMDGVSIAIEDEEFEDMDITEEDKREIIELSNRPDIYDAMVDSIAPAIYGYEEEKLAMILQLFSGVTKRLPDGSRIRGDLHMLLIGDPGTGKCQEYNTKVTLADGTETAIGDLVESNLDEPIAVDDGVYEPVDIGVQTVTEAGAVEIGNATKVWKREAPDRMYRITMASGREVEVTPSHPLFKQSDRRLSPQRADQFAEGDLVAAPQCLDAEWNDSIDVSFQRVEAYNANPFTPPERLDPTLSRLLGYIIAEGYTQVSGSSAATSITNVDEEILTDAENCFRQLGLRWSRRRKHDHETAEIVSCSSLEFVRFLKELEPAILETSEHQVVPSCLKRATPPNKAAFLRTFIDSEGTVSATQREITVSSMSRELLTDVQTLLVTFGIQSHVRARHNDSYRLRISGGDFIEYVDEIGFVTDRKTAAAEAFDDVSENTNTDVVPGLSDDLRRIREALALSQSDLELPRPTYQHYERGDRNPSKASLRAVVDTFETRLAWLRKKRRELLDGDWQAVETLRRELNVSQRTLSDGMDVSQTAISYYERNEVAPDGGRTAAAKDVILDRLDEALSVASDVSELDELCENDVHWDRIESIVPVEPDYEWVYDLEVAETHTYLGNGIVSHNSQMLSYIRQIAPRSVYTSGKGSSSAGLTAAAVRDDFGDGQQWTLEAGALVLADKGIAAVDELDKMRSEDRSAMHQALEQQQISVNKAGINATLKSRCSLLGAANPKYGRFDQYEPIGEQIDLEPALISRFDLIFTVTDQPDPEHDARLAQHIIKTNYAGELNTQREKLASSEFTAEQVADVTDEVAPEIDADLLRKYIAHAKRDCYPTMTEEAKELIEQFYVDLRSKGADEDAPVPVTARKLEALVRLSEASARVRLSDTVEREDADRATGIVESCLKDIGVDPETGQFDADVVETGTSKTQRDRIKNIKGLIADIETEYEEGAPVEEVLGRAGEIGMDQTKAEAEIEKLRTKGEVYEPKQGHLRTT
ncbi:helix-turn-helix domain-containing protein [Halorubrum sp. JWXQ-INN 858]|uniref:LAGLIDADG family homing endonuclease n=1 Tax=Halorubrum sp. JWXQ-INN 858 TaxID=2690782 RepID=UPI001357B306|nr:LAGLIDADG family homing endonuclease [Halorubrum sp. JWXQ-INN 858]MWV66102.1 helix-turn-helix domain-containing protein [Halorubrum sp. JWXQ-INN 858]